MKVLFLDVDGVLNCRDTFMKADKRNIYLLDSVLVDRLKYIMKMTGCAIVVSSTWRNDPDGMKALHDAGIKTISMTPRLPGGYSADECIRGKEVLTWLMERNWEITRYAILDDDPDFFKWQPLFQTSFNGGGLLPGIAESVIEYLNQRPEQKELPF